MTVSERSAQRRNPGETLVEVDDNPSGSVLRVITDQAGDLVDSLTVLLHRLGVGYRSLTHSSPSVERDADGRLTGVHPEGWAGPAESWITVELARPVNQDALAESVRLLPHVVADARAVGSDAAALTAGMRNLAARMDADTGARFPGPDRQDVADLLRWLLDGHFVVLGALSCAVDGSGPPRADEATRLGVARLRTEVLPRLTAPHELLVLARATIPSFLRYGAYPYVVVVRERSDSGNQLGGQERSDSGNQLGGQERSDSGNQLGGQERSDWGINSAGRSAATRGIGTARSSTASSACSLRRPATSMCWRSRWCPAGCSKPSAWRPAIPSTRANCCSRCSRPFRPRKCSTSSPGSCWRWRARSSS